MPLILHNSIHILSDAGLGMAMFSLGMCSLTRSIESIYAKDIKTL